MAKSRRRKLIRQYKNDLLKERQTMNLRKDKVRKDPQYLKEQNLWDVLDSNFLYSQNSSVESSSILNFMSSLKVEDISTEQVVQPIKATLFSQDFFPFHYQES